MLPKRFELVGWKGIARGKSLGCWKDSRAQEGRKLPVESLDAPVQWVKEAFA